MYDPRSLYIKFPKLPSPGAYALIYSFFHFSIGIIIMLVNIFHFTPFDHVTCMFYMSCNTIFHVKDSLRLFDVAVLLHQTIVQFLQSIPCHNHTECDIQHSFFFHLCFFGLLLHNMLPIVRPLLNIT